MIRTFFLIALMSMGAVLVNAGTRALPLEEGATLYKKFCKSCHGKSADRANKNIPSLTTSSLTRAEKEAVMRQGRNKMPAFSAVLTDAEIDAILDFVEGLPKE